MLAMADKGPIENKNACRVTCNFPQFSIHIVRLLQPGDYLLPGSLPSTDNSGFFWLGFFSRLFHVELIVDLQM